MPIYEYKGQQYDITTEDPVEAKNKILGYLQSQPVKETPVNSALSPQEQAAAAAGPFSGIASILSRPSKPRPVAEPTLSPEEQVMGAIGAPSDELTKMVAAPQGRVNAEGQITSMTRDQYAEELRKRGEQTSERTAKSTAIDAGVTALKAAIGLPESFVGLVNIPTMGYAGKILKDMGYNPGEAKAILDTYLSEAQQVANRKVSEAEGFFPTVGAALQNPSVIASSVAESLPQMLGGVYIAKGVLKAAPSLSPLLAAAVGEGVLGAGSAAEQIRQQSKDELLSGKQALSALGSGVGTAAFSIAGGKFANKLGVSDIDTLLVAGSSKFGAKSVADFAKKAALSGVSEGFFEEMPQSAQEQMWMNYATDKPILNGVPEAAGMGFVTGSVMGGAATALSGRKQTPQEERAKALADALTTGAAGATVDQTSLDELVRKSLSPESGIQAGTNIRAQAPMVGEIAPPVAAPIIPAEPVAAAAPVAPPVDLLAGLAAAPSESMDTEAMLRELMGEPPKTTPPVTVQKPKTTTPVTVEAQERIKYLEDELVNWELVGLRPQDDPRVQAVADELNALKSQSKGVPSVDEAPQAQQAKTQEQQAPAAPVVTPPVVEPAKQKVSAKTENVTKTYDAWDDEGHKYEVNIVRDADGKLFRIYLSTTNEEGKTQRSELSVGYGEGIGDDYIVKAITDPMVWSLTPPAEAKTEEAIKIAEQMEALGEKNVSSGIRGAARSPTVERNLPFYREKLQELTAQKGKAEAVKEAFNWQEFLQPGEQKYYGTFQETAPQQAKDAFASVTNAILDVTDAANNLGYKINDIKGNASLDARQLKSQYTNLLSDGLKLLSSHYAIQNEYKRANPEKFDLLIAGAQDSARAAQQAIRKAVPKPEEVAGAEQRITEGEKAVSKLKTGPKLSLWNALTGALGQGDMVEMFSRNIPLYAKKLQAKKGSRKSSIADLTASGALDEFLPYQMRHTSQVFDNQESEEYIKEQVRSQNYISYDVQQEIEQIFGSIEDAESIVNEYLTTEEQNLELEKAADEQRQSEIAARGLEPESEIPAVEPDEGEALAPTTPEGLRAAEERRTKIEADQAKTKKEAEARAKADEEVGSFTLTGSNRIADVAAAQGQKDIFAQEEEPEETKDAARERVLAPVRELAEKLLEKGTERYEDAELDGKIYQVKTRTFAGKLFGSELLTVEKALGLARDVALINQEDRNMMLALTGKNVGEGRNVRIMDSQYIEQKESQPSEILSLEYQGALEDSREAIADFRKAQQAYRDQKIDDKEFLVERRKYDLAIAKYDQAFAKEQETVPEKVTQAGNEEVLGPVEKPAAPKLTREPYTIEGDFTEIGEEKQHLLLADQSSKLTEDQNKTLESQYGAKRDTAEFLDGLRKDVIAFITQGAQAVNGKIRAIIRRVANGILAVAIDESNYSFDTYTSEEEQKRSPSLKRELKTLNRKRLDGRITDAEYVERSDAAIRADEDARLAEEPQARQRGYLLIQEKLSAAARRGDISRDAFDLANWFMSQNEDLVKDLGISIKSKGAAGAGGFYNDLTRIFTIIKHGGSHLTATHEILHHLERMMPTKVQQAIRKAWASQLAKASAKAKLPVEKLYFAALMNAHYGENQNSFLDIPKGAELAFANVRRALEDKPGSTSSAEFAGAMLKLGLIPMENYEYFNPSEFWAVNGSDIVQARYDAVQGGVLAKLKNWLKEFGQKIKSLFGLKSDASIIRALDSLSKADGEFVTDEMLGQGDYYSLRNYKGNAAPAALWDSPEPSFMDGITYQLADKQIDTKRVVDEIRKTTGQIDERLDAYTKESLYSSKSAAQIEDFLKDKFTPLFEQMRALGVTVDEMETYLHNRHAEERNEQINKINLAPDIQDIGSGISTDDAQKYLAGLPAAQKAKLQSLAAKVDGIIEGTQKLLVDSGLETKETVDTWNKTYKHYIPLQRDDLDFVHTGSGYVGGVGTKGSSSRRAVGSIKPVKDILANIAIQRERAIRRSEQAVVGRALYGLAITSPNPGFWLPVNPNAIKNKAKLVQEMVSLGLTIQDAENLIQEPKVPVIDKATGLVKYQVNPSLRGSDNVFPVRINGEDRFIIFNPKDERAMRMARSLKNLDADELGWFLGNMGAVTRWIASVNTQYNPVFGAWNMARDVQSAALNLSTTEIAGKEKEVLKGTMPALFAIYKNLRGIPAKNKSEQEYMDLFQQMRRAGGTTGFAKQFSGQTENFGNFMERMKTGKPKEKVNIVEQELKKLDQGNARKAAQAVFNWLSDYNDAMENAVRVSAFKVALQNHSEQKAASIAKELTVNFNRKGASSPTLQALYAFINASIQGSVRLGKTLRGPAGKKIIAGGIILGVAQALALALNGYDDGDPPEFLKDKNFIIPIPFAGDNYAIIPMPLGFNVFPGIGRILTEALLIQTGMLKSNKGVTDKLLGVGMLVLDSFNPLGAGSLTQMVTPTALDPIFAIAENKSAFGRPIYREDRDTQPTPGYQRSRDSATAVSQALAEFMNYVSSPSGSEYTKGRFSPTADEIDYLAGQYFGGVAREVIKGAETVKSYFTGEDIPTYRKPIIGKLYGETQSPAAVSSKFYDNISQMAKYENEIKKRMENNQPTDEYLENNPEAILWKRANKVESEVAKLNKTRSEYLKDDDMENVKRIDEMKNEKMKMFNDSVKEAQ